MKATAKVDAIIFGKRYSIDREVEEEGVIKHESVLNTWIPSESLAAVGIDIGFGGGTESTFSGTFAAFDDDTYTVGDRVTFFYNGGVDKVVGGLVSDEGANFVRVTGADTNFPAEETVGYLFKDTSIDVSFEGDDLECFAVYCEAAATVTFWASDVSKLAIDLTAGQSYFWMKNTGYTNPLAGESITEVGFVMYGAVGTEVCKFAALHNNVE